MDLCFVETMRGTLIDGGRRTYAIELRLKAFAPALGRFLHDGRTELSGIVRAAPYATAAPAKGTLTLGLRELAYRLEFRGDDGQIYALHGTKYPTPFAPVRSMTAMTVRLLDASGEPCAVGRMHFRLRDLGGFVASWIPGSRRQQRALDVERRRLERHLLDGRNPTDASP